MKRALPVPKPKRARTARAAQHKAKAAPLFSPSDVRRAVVELADILAPADLGPLLVEEPTLRARAAQLEGSVGEVLRAQIDLALVCLRDHQAGACPQIPYRTISLLAAGIAYMTTSLDLIPDFLPGKGTLDDAMVMMATIHLSRDGVRRYCTWKGIATEPALATVRARADRKEDS